MAKTYTVVKDGIELKELKTLPAAKKLADAEGAEVVCDGEVVYTPNLVPSADVGSVADAEADPTPSAEEETTVEEVKTDTEDTATVEDTPDQYTLTTRMNVRKEPDTAATKIRVAEKGTVVDVLHIENDWLCLTDGSFILYGGGKYAKKN